MKPAFLDKLIERLDKLDPTSLQMQFLRLTREKGVLEAMFNTIQDGILVLDAGGHVLYANAAAAGLLGFKPEGRRILLCRAEIRNEAGDLMAEAVGKFLPSPRDTGA